MTIGKRITISTSSGTPCVVIGSGSKLVAPFESVSIGCRDNISYTFWFNTEAPPSNYPLVSYTNNMYGSGVQYFLEPNGEDKCTIAVHSSNRNYVSSGISIQNNVWNFGAIVLDTVNGTTTWKMYSNGTSKDIFTRTDGWTYVSGQLRLGIPDFYNSLAFTVMLAELRLFKKALSDDEVLSMYYRKPSILANHEYLFNRNLLDSGSDDHVDLTCETGSCSFSTCKLKAT